MKRSPQRKWNKNIKQFVLMKWFHQGRLFFLQGIYFGMILAFTFVFYPQCVNNKNKES